MTRLLAISAILVASIATQPAHSQQSATGTDAHQHESHDSDMASCPLHAKHMQEAAASEDEDFKAMNERGARAMGFDQYKTTHHFRNLPDGGAIEVTVNDPKDTMNLDAIRKHFRRIASEFAEGNFTAPLETHGELPPGAANMQKLKSKITYSYEELPNGARVHIATSDPAALQAIHEFFGYQIKEHRTGD